MKVLHIIAGLGDGGAEGVLYRLCLHDNINDHVVISFMDEGKYGPSLEERGIKLYTLGQRKGRFSLKSFFRLCKLIKRINPDVVQTWMYHADLIGGIASRLVGIRCVFWGIRTADISMESASTRIVARVCAAFSKIIPLKIACCAHSAIESHVNLGYTKDKMVIINNGFDFDKFTFKLIEDRNLNKDHKMKFGMVGRYTHQKDHLNLIKALSIVNSKFDNWECTLIGNGLDSSNYDLNNHISEHNLVDKVVLSGPSYDIPSKMQLLDLHILSSAVEGFPNVLAEAMSCGVVCISTDVGDAKQIISDMGWIVPPKRAELLANAILSAVKTYYESPKEWSNIRYGARRRVVKYYSLENMVDTYNDIWSSR
ncbi:glycosyltransferase family 4 protein [Vibrio lentus]|uniref:glycosyltransferase family 4 protein n=1 Tax=Vibrio lentus TaxID=136468 RepID=UPI000C81E224|nr:glycosyltransferase [Vibrio lentus]PMM56248.1 hypothetical protein BCT51_22960 [Vibrio lentus]